MIESQEQFQCNVCELEFAVEVLSDPTDWRDYAECYCPNCGVGIHSEEP